MKFTGTDSYVATDDLTVAVNAAVTLERPLLVKGEPGTGKTSLARAVAESLGMPLLTWHIKSTTSAKEGLYEYDVVQRLNDSLPIDWRLVQHDLAASVAWPHEIHAVVVPTEDECQRITAALRDVAQHTQWKVQGKLHLVPSLWNRETARHDKVEVRTAPIAVMRHIIDRKSTRLNSSHRCISYAVFCLKKKKKKTKRNKKS